MTAEKKRRQAAADQSGVEPPHSKESALLPEFAELERRIELHTRVVVRFDEPGGVVVNGPSNPCERSVIMPITLNVTRGSAAYQT
jgi:hypothetical protein